MINKKIVFIQPPTSLEDIYGGLAKVGTVSPPINLLLLAAITRKYSFEPTILDCPAQGWGIKDVIQQLIKISPSFVGLTAMTPHIVQAGKLAKEIKKHFPVSYVLLGGPHISAVPEETMRRFNGIDVGFIGEADLTLPDVLTAIYEKRRYDNLLGTIFRSSSGKLINNGQQTEKVDLDNLPLPAWDLLREFPGRYTPPLFATHRLPATPILTSRGCPAKCTFCYSGGHKTIATYSADYTMKMLKYLKSHYGIKEFMIFDDNFVMFKKNLLKFLDVLIDAKLDLTWSCNARVDMVDLEILQLMKRAGCWQISFGIETGNKDIMSLLGKRATKERITETLNLCREIGIRTVGYFMIGHFKETQETIDETIEFAKSISLDDFRMSFFTPLPGTKSYNVAKDFGTFDDNWEKMNLFSPIFIPHGLTEKQLINSQKKAIRQFFFRPRPVWSYVKMVRNPIIFTQGAYSLAKYIFSKGSNNESLTCKSSST